MEIDIDKQSLHLLHEIIEEETMPMLSVKSLLRFRCISKSWRSLIDGKRFIMKQYQNSTKDPSLAHHRAFLISRHGALLVSGGPSKVAQCSLLSLRDEVPPVSHDLAESDLPNTIHPSLVSSISIIGCCNGLVCILIETHVHGQQFIVWNPCMRLFKTIHHSSRDIMNYRFYWDEESDDYRVISNEGRNYVRNVCRIYTARKNSCKEIRACDFSHRDCIRGGMLAGGRLHWRGREPSNDIVAFDLKSEAFETLVQPSYPNGYARLVLGLIGECLSVQRWRQEDERMEVWVMKEYGVSWEILFLLEACPTFCPTFSLDVGRFCIGKEGEILLIKIGKYHDL